MLVGRAAEPTEEDLGERLVLAQIPCVERPPGLPSIVRQTDRVASR
jgi:hypothetical protein